MKFALFLFPAVLLAACTAAPPVAIAPPVRPGPMTPWTPEPTGLRVTVEPRIAAPGATVTLVLHNATAHQAGYNLCSSSLDQLQSGIWRPVPQTSACTRELRVLGAGQQARYQKQLPTTLATGTYRFATGVEIPLNRGTPALGPIQSEPFSVRR